jgi:ankyrin repeat protein
MMAFVLFVCYMCVPSPPRATSLLHDCCNGYLSDSSLGKTPLHVCAEGWTGAYDGARALLEYGASPRAKDRRGRTPIDVAAKDEVEDLLISWECTSSVL